MPTSARNKDLLVIRRGDPCGHPQAGQSPSPTHLKIRFRRGRRPRRPVLPHFLLHSVGRAALSPPPDNHRTPCAHKCLRRGTFCHQRQKVPKERRQNQWFWIPCAGVVREVSGPFNPANKTVQPRPVLSHCPCVYPPRRAPRLCCPSKQGCPLRLSCGAMWASRPTKFYRQPLRRGDPRGRPPGLAPHPLQKSLSLRTSDRFTGVAIRIPRPQNCCAFHFPLFPQIPLPSPQFTLFSYFSCCKILPHPL